MSSTKDELYEALEEVEEQLEERRRERRESTSRERADELDRQIRALEEAASRLREAINTLREEKESAIKGLEQVYQELREIDAYAAAQLRKTIDDMRNYVNWLNNLEASINDVFPITQDNFVDAAAAIAQAGNLASIIAASSANSFPGQAAAANNLMGVGVQIFNVTVTKGIDKSGIGFLNALEMAGVDLLCAVFGDPINMATGNFYYEKSDIAIHGRFPLEFKRFYNAMGGLKGGIIGDGWTHNYNVRLYEYEDQIHIYLEDGQVETYTKLEDGFYVTSVKSNRAITIPEEGGFDLTCQDARRYRFNKEGRIAKVVDHTGRSAIFTYNGTELATATHPNGGTLKYDYENGRLNKITNPLGIESVQNQYDYLGRATMQSIADGGVMHLSYDDDRMLTLATDQLGYKTEYYRDENTAQQKSYTRMKVTNPTSTMILATAKQFKTAIKTPGDINTIFSS
jgi:hypothetical protein